MGFQLFVSNEATTTVFVRADEVLVFLMRLHVVVEVLLEGEHLGANLAHMSLALHVDDHHMALQRILVLVLIAADVAHCRQI